jgi:streptomycin 6-kinase
VDLRAHGDAGFAGAAQDRPDPGVGVLTNARNLASDNQPAVLVHGDLHLGNILRADDGPRAIDPHGLVGDPAYDFLQVLRGDWNAVTAEPNLGRAVDRRIAEFAEAADLDRDRVSRWSQARATASALWLRDLQKPDSAIASRRSSLDEMPGLRRHTCPGVP